MFLHDSNYIRRWYIILIHLKQPERFLLRTQLNLSNSVSLRSLAKEKKNQEKDYRLAPTSNLFIQAWKKSNQGGPGGGGEDFNSFEGNQNPRPAPPNLCMLATDYYIFLFVGSLSPREIETGKEKGRQILWRGIVTLAIYSTLQT